MNAFRRNRYKGKTSHKSKHFVERRSSFRLAFNKANLFPLPKKNIFDSEWFRVVKLGRNPKIKQPNKTLHLRQKDAKRLLLNDIHEEAAEMLKVPKVNIQAVIWRHTGGYGNFAKHFLVEVIEPLGIDSSGRVPYRTRLLLRTRMPVRVELASGRVKYRGRYVVLHNEQENERCIWSIEQGHNDMLARLPDNLFESAVDALDKYSKTGVCTWFPESRDKWVRESFCKIYVSGKDV
jgi:hypothetical protein